MEVEVDLILGRKLGKAVAIWIMQKVCSPVTAWSRAVPEWEGKLSKFTAIKLKQMQKESTFPWPHCLGKRKLPAST